MSELDDLLRVSIADKLRLNYRIGRKIQDGYNGPSSMSYNKDLNKIEDDHTIPSRIRQGKALGLGGLGGALGAYGGSFAGSKLADLLGVDGLKLDKKTGKKKRSILKSLARAGLISASTVGGGIGGAMLGTTVAGKLSDVPDEVRSISAVLNRPKNRKNALDKAREYYSARGYPGDAVDVLTEASDRLLVPVNTL